jgi:hypothetical protein
VKSKTLSGGRPLSKQSITDRFVGVSVGASPSYRSCRAIQA